MKTQPLPNHPDQRDPAAALANRISMLGGTLCLLLSPSASKAAFEPGTVPLGRIAYTTSSYDSIQVLDTSSGSVQSVPLPAGKYYGPDWAPDGRLVFQRGDLQEAAIWTVQLDGEGLSRITDPGYRTDVDVSRDGQHLAYQIVSSSLLTKKRDGTGAETTYDALAFAQWNPDGSGVLGSDWGINSTYETDLYLYDLGSRTRTPMTQHKPGESYQYGEYSPDGTRIIAHRLQSGTRSHIVLIDLGTKTETLLTSDWPGTYHAFPTWDATGDFVIFESDREGDMDLWTLKLDGSVAPVNLTRGLSTVSSAPSFLAEVPEPAVYWTTTGLLLMVAARATRRGRTHLRVTTPQSRNPGTGEWQRTGPA